ncbi:MAG TPA: hypothetical protein ENI62_05930 [Gammaproteobacteria bacterium]|nr:hypothetical protein [Gammaproteobacteria bacterium]
MDGGQTTQLLRSGDVKIFGDVHSIRDGQVYFQGGEQVKPDLIIFATGYRPFLDYVSDILLDPDTGTHVIMDRLQIIADKVFFSTSLRQPVSQ